MVEVNAAESLSTAAESLEAFGFTRMPEYFYGSSEPPSRISMNLGYTTKGMRKMTQDGDNVIKINEQRVADTSG